MSIETTYRPLITVATGIKAQIEANLNALEVFKDLPDEANKLGETLAAAHALCETIISKGNAEPDPNE